MIQEDLKLAEEAEQDQHTVQAEREKAFEVRADVWDDHVIAPVYVQQHRIQRQQFYTGDA